MRSFEVKKIYYREQKRSGRNAFQIGIRVNSKGNGKGLGRSSED